MTFNLIIKAIYALFLTNKYGFKLRKKHTPEETTRLRLAYAEALLSRLNINVEVECAEKLKKNGQYLIISNHRSVIDPLIIEIAFKGSDINSLWVAKKELYNSFFFGMFTRNAGTILLDRDSKQMSAFFGDIKAGVADGYSISVFPEGTRNKTEAPLAEFKEGSQIIAIKNRLPILPVYIKTNANEVLMESLKHDTPNLKIVIEIGDIIEYKDRSGSLQELYKTRFNIA